MPRQKKLTKSIESSVVTLTFANDEVRNYDFNSLPSDIQAKFGPFGLGHKLGDSCAGKDNAEDCIAAVEKVWEGLLNSDWTVRAPAGPKVTKKSLVEAMSNLSEDEQEAARQLLAKLGISA